MTDTNFSRWRPHPWHGLDVGVDAPRIVNAYIEITPFDAIKYEIDKATGYLRVDRPQRSSSHPPALYGFVPQTYCGERVAKLAPESSGGDDKIIAVLEGDYVWDKVEEITALPPVLVERLEHYFSTYKMVPGQPNKMQIVGTYGYAHAAAVIQASCLDYIDKFGTPDVDRRRPTS